MTFVKNPISSIRHLLLAETMSRLLAFPNETLLQVINEVVHVDLENLTLSCKLIYELGKHALQTHRKRKAKYTNIICGPIRDGKNATELHPTLLLRDVLMDSDVALYPLHLSLSAFIHTFGPSVLDEAIRILPELNDIVKSIIHRIPYAENEFEEEWISSVLKGGRCSTVVLLLCLLPNLQSFSTSCHGMSRALKENRLSNKQSEP